MMFRTRKATRDIWRGRTGEVRFRELESRVKAQVSLPCRPPRVPCQAKKRDKGRHDVHQQRSTLFQVRESSHPSVFCVRSLALTLARAQSSSSA